MRELAEQLRRAHPLIREIRRFGSWVDGGATAGSDVDLCLIVECEPRPRWQRAAAYLPDRFRQPLDLVVLTAGEWARLPELSPGLHRAIEAGRIV